MNVGNLIDRSSWKVAGGGGAGGISKVCGEKGKKVLGCSISRKLWAVF